MAKKDLMQITERTQPFKRLAAYALPYGTGYILLPYILNQFEFMLGGILLSIFVVIVLNLIVITIFYKRQHRLLEKLECSRIALLSMLLTLVMSLLAFLLFFDSMGVSWLQLSDKGIHKVIALSAFVAFIINYAVVFYSLWWMQKLWKK